MVILNIYADDVNLCKVYGNQKLIDSNRQIKESYNRG